MADPAAIMRAASAGQQPMMGAGPSDGAEGEAPHSGPEQVNGLDQMVESLRGVGEFLKAQGPDAQAALGAFQALLQAMTQMGGKGPEQQPQSAPPQQQQSSGRLHESQFPGAQVL